MPEMPEVQAHAMRVDDAIAGNRVKKIELLNFAALKTFDPSPTDFYGKSVLSVTHRAKYFVFSFDDELVCVMHLMQGGRFRFDSKRNPKPRNGLIRFVFSNDETGDEQAWLLTEAGKERKAGIWLMRGDPNQREPLSKLGPDAGSLTEKQLAKILSSHSKRIHGVLRDQKVFAGIGRLLANEICHRAKLSPFANAAKLDAKQVHDLHKALQTVLAESLKHEKTLDDIGKSIDRPSLAHNRSGEPCLSCEADEIATVAYVRYTVFYCPTCQTNGKKLRDNTTSKFLK